MYLLVSVDDAPTAEVVRRKLDHDPVLREDPDVVLAHLSADVSEDLVPVAQLHAEHRVRKGLHNGALHLDDAFFFRHAVLQVGISSSGGPGTSCPDEGAGGPRAATSP